MVGAMAFWNVNRKISPPSVMPVTSPARPVAELHRFRHSPASWVRRTAARQAVWVSQRLAALPVRLPEPSCVQASRTGIDPPLGDRKNRLWIGTDCVQGERLSDGGVIIRGGFR